MSHDEANPRDPTEPTEPTNEGEQHRRTELSLDQLQTMITGSIQAALPSLEEAIATKVADSLQSRGKLLSITSKQP